MVELVLQEQHLELLMILTSLITINGNLDLGVVIKIKIKTKELLTLRQFSNSLEVQLQSNNNLWKFIRRNSGKNNSKKLSKVVKLVKVREVVLKLNRSLTGYSQHNLLITSKNDFI